MTAGGMIDLRPEPVAGVHRIDSASPGRQWTETHIPSIDRRTPDAVHAATAVPSGATGIVSNDARLWRIAPDVRAWLLDDLAGSRMPESTLSSQ